MFRTQVSSKKMHFNPQTQKIYIPTIPQGSIRDMMATRNQFAQDAMAPRNQFAQDAMATGNRSIRDIAAENRPTRDIATEDSNDPPRKYIRDFIKIDKNKHPNSYRIQSIIGVAIIFITIAIIYIQLDRETLPTSMAMAKLQTTTIATQAINEAIAQTLATNQTTIEDLLAYDYNDDGDQVSWNVNSILINNLCAQIIARCSDALQNIGVLPFKIPLGNLTGSRIFANLGPELTIEVLPIGTVTVDYDNDLKETGINQVNHTVWLDVVATIQIVVPLFEEEVVVARRIMLIDKVSSGEVPPSYVNVPSNSILDAPLESPGFDY